MSYYLWIVVSTYILLWLTSHHFFPDGEAFTCRPGRESTRRSKRVPRGGRLLSQLDCDFSEVQIRKETIIGLEVGKDQWMQWRSCGVADQSAHFLKLNNNFHFQGALAVLKQFLESNLVRIDKTAPLRKWLIVDCRSTWATNLPTSVAWWRHTGDGHWSGWDSRCFCVEYFCEVKSKSRQKSRTGAGNTNGAPQQVTWQCRKY